MIKAIKAVQRSYQRAPYKSFALSQRQHSETPKSAPVPNRVTAMQHKIKQGGSTNV